MIVCSCCNYCFNNEPITVPLLGHFTWFVMLLLDSELSSSHSPDASTMKSSVVCCFCVEMITLLALDHVISMGVTFLFVGTRAPCGSGAVRKCISV